MVAGVGRVHLETAARHLEPLLDAVRRSMIGRTPSLAPASEALVVRAPLVNRPSLSIRAADYLSAPRAVTPVPVVDAPADTRRYRRRIVEELPTPLWTEWQDPDGFADALRLHIKRHGDSIRHLYHAVGKPDQATNHTTIRRWVSGELIPRSIGSLEILRRIEHRYRLPEGYSNPGSRTNLVGFEVITSRSSRRPSGGAWPGTCPMTSTVARRSCRRRSSTGSSA